MPNLYGMHGPRCRGCYDHRLITGYHVPAHRAMTEVDRAHLADWEYRPQPIYAAVRVVTPHGIAPRSPAARKQPGRRYGPAPAGTPRDASAMPAARRLDAYAHQRGTPGRYWGPLTPRQSRRLEKKFRSTKEKTA